MSDFWRDDVFGKTFIRKQINITDSFWKADLNTPLVLITYNSEGRRCKKAQETLEKKGYTVKNVISPQEFQDGYDPICENDGVYIVIEDQIYDELSYLLNNSKIRIQLFSMVSVFSQVMRPQMKMVYDLLEDDTSKEVYTKVLEVRTKMKPYSHITSSCYDKQYFIFPEMLKRSFSSVFVDCGAYVGENLDSYLTYMGGIIGSYYAFEPGQAQFNALMRRRERLLGEWALNDSQIVCVRAGVGQENTELYLNTNGGRTANSIIIEEGNNSEKIEIKCLDDYFKKIHVDFIKADIEGSEMDMLRGAANIIKRDKPMMAICIYHKLTDYYEIPLFLHELVPEYKFRIRHHSITFEETVLYCLIDKR